MSARWPNLASPPNKTIAKAEDGRYDGINMMPHGLKMEPSPQLPLDLLASRPAVRVLRYLATHPGTYTGRQLAAAAGVARIRAADALSRLTSLGIVERRPAGRAYLYTLNEDSYLVSDVLGPVFRNEARWLDRLGEEVLASLNAGVESVILYGSWARGDAAERSDVDLLAVTATMDGRRQAERVLEAQRGRLSERFGRFVSFLVLSRNEVRRRLRRGDRLMRNIVRQGRVLAGHSLAELIARG